MNESNPTIIEAPLQFTLMGSFENSPHTGKVESEDDDEQRLQSTHISSPSGNVEVSLPVVDLVHLEDVKQNIQYPESVETESTPTEDTEHTPDAKDAEISQDEKLHKVKDRRSAIESFSPILKTNDTSLNVSTNSNKCGDITLERNGDGEEPTFKMTCSYPNEEAIQQDETTGFMASSCVGLRPSYSSPHFSPIDVSDGESDVVYSPSKNPLNQTFKLLPEYDDNGDSIYYECMPGSYDQETPADHVFVKNYQEENLYHDKEDDQQNFVSHMKVDNQQYLGSEKKEVNQQSLLVSHKKVVNQENLISHTVEDNQQNIVSRNKEEQGHFVSHIVEDNQPDSRTKKEYQNLASHDVEGNQENLDSQTKEDNRQNLDSHVEGNKENLDVDSNEDNAQSTEVEQGLSLDTSYPDSGTEMDKSPKEDIELILSDDDGNELFNCLISKSAVLTLPTPSTSLSKLDTEFAASSVRYKEDTKKFKYFPDLTASGCDDEQQTTNNQNYSERKQS